MNPTPRSRCGFTLADCLVLVIVVAVAIPSLMAAVRTQDGTAIDAQRRVSAAWLASAVLETVMADAASTDNQLGFDKLDTGSYLSNPSKGLYARLSGVTGAYEALGLSYAVSVGSPLDLSGAPAKDKDPFALREIVVTVSFTDRSGRVRSATFRTIVANT